MANFINKTLFLFCCLLAFISCEEEILPPANPDPVPTIYSFDRNGSTSVEYSGQTVRQLLIQDLKTVTDRLGNTGATQIEANDLLKFFDKSVNGGLTLQDNILTNVGNFPITETTYFEIHPDKDLLGETGFRV